MESAGEAAFDDLLALAQVGTRGEVKLELGRNFWDELGAGRREDVHTHLFESLVKELQVEVPSSEELPWQVLARANVMLWSCIPRANAFRAQGVLGAVEILAAGRCAQVSKGALRAGIPEQTMRYYRTHAEVDIGHGSGWMDRVIHAQVAEFSQARIGIAEGLLVRADSSLDYFDYCLGEVLGGQSCRSI